MTRWLLLACGLWLLPAFAWAAACPAANPNDNTADDAALQTCLNAGGTISLDAGSVGYLIATGGLDIPLDGTVLTSTNPASRATFKAAPTLNNAFIVVSNVARAYTISNLIFDGNKANRTVTCSFPDRNNGTNLYLRGTGSVIDNVDSINTLCGSAMVLVGFNYEVKNSHMTNSGTHTSLPPDSPYEADGMTVGFCGGTASIHDNTVTNSTDLGIVVGGSDGGGCHILNNTVVQNGTAAAFAGIGLACFASPSCSTMTNVLVQGNTITSTLNMMGMGLSIGSLGWFPGIISGGTVQNNSVSGAAVGIDIYGWSNGTLANNTITNTQGNLSGFSADFAASQATNICMPLGWITEQINIVPRSSVPTSESLGTTCGAPPPPNVFFDMDFEGGSGTAFGNQLENGSIQPATTVWAYAGGDCYGFGAFTVNREVPCPDVDETTAQAFTGTHSLYAHYNLNDQADVNNQAVATPYWAPATHIFLRYYFKAVNFVNNLQNFSKMMYYRTLGYPNQISGFYFGSGELSFGVQVFADICPLTGNGPYQDCTYLPNVASRPIVDGQWHCVEEEVDFGTPGTQNGHLRIWIDSPGGDVNKTLDYTLDFLGPVSNVNPPGLGSNTTPGNYMDHIQFFKQNFPGAISGDRYIDRFAAGPSRIGCLGSAPQPDTIPPSAPSAPSATPTTPTSIQYQVTNGVDNVSTNLNLRLERCTILAGQTVCP